MKKKLLGVALLAGLATFACACMSNSTSKNVEDKETDKKSEETSDEINDETNEEDIEFDGEENSDVCYYGCPNSKRVKKLNTKKRRV